ncbi:hypothetical protein BN1708_008625 [Verticillium longisporum]|uniref:Fibroin-3 n=1 Tax=Verticillium longisporum TaxID=100787 RepID=A0A0G4N693_VERLO|nr:hypothetical protein BN1708_008625 [Verticillium longisporum]
MPNVDVAMARSLRGGWWGSITAGIAENLQQRQVTDAVNNVGNTVNDVTNTVTDIRTALSSWDNCISVSWCKWPVIAVIIVGGLIIFSIVWCVIRCMCCGLSCCCTCFSCLKCCGNCCGCCDAPGDKKHKYLDESYGAHALPPGQGYKSQPAMFASAIPVSNPDMTPSHGVTTASPPQYAEFDVSKKRLSDALPAMPTWESAGSKRISLEQEAVEMDTMKKPVAAQSMNNLQSSPTIPLMATGAMSPHLPSPNTPYGQAQGGFGGQGQQMDSYAAVGNGYSDYSDNKNGYNQSTTSFGNEQAYGAAAAGMAMNQGRHTPHQDNSYGAPRGNGYAQDYKDSYDQPQSYGMSAGPVRTSPSPSPSRAYGPPRTQPSPAPPGFRRSPGPQSDSGYARPQYSQDRQYSDASRPLAGPSSPAHQQGFDFGGSGGGYGGRPQQQQQQQSYGYDDDQHHQQQHDQRPPKSSGSEIAYPGFRAYQPAQQGWSGV